MAKRILAWNDEAGQFYREMGKKPNGKPARFYLGADEKKPAVRIARLEGLWEGVVAWWQDLKREDLTDATFACWDDVTLSLGRAIAKGEWTVTVEPPDDYRSEPAVWLASLRTYFPMIQAQVADTRIEEEGNQEMIEVGRKMVASEEAPHQKEMREIKSIVKPFGGTVATQETLHDALDAYKTWIEKSFVDIGGRTTQSGKKQGERTDRIKRYAKDMPLSDCKQPPKPCSARGASLARRRKRTLLAAVEMSGAGRVSTGICFWLP